MGGRCLPSTNMAAAATAAVRLLLVAGLGASRVVGEGSEQAQVLGVRLENGTGASMDGGIISARPGSVFFLRLYGLGLRNNTWPWLSIGAPGGQSCTSAPDAPLQLLQRFLVCGEHSCLVAVQVQEGVTVQKDLLYPLCILQGGEWVLYSGGDMLFAVLGDGEKSFGGDRGSCDQFVDKDQASDGATDEYLATWLLAFLIVLCVLLSGLLRGLQLSTLILEPPELGILRDWGSPSERLGAARLDYLRTRWGGYTLISLLALCCIANAAVAVLLYLAIGSIAGAIFSAAGLLWLAGEALPAAISSRWGPWLASKCLWLTHFLLLLPGPISFPLSWLLEKMIGLDPSCCYMRLRILEMARCGDPYSELVRDEFSKGALRNRTVEDILTPVNDCFMLATDALLDFSTMSSIMESGYTRIPVYENERTNIVDILYLKDLAYVDPDDCTPLSTITRFYSHPVHFVFSDTKLDAVLEEFKKGEKALAVPEQYVFICAFAHASLCAAFFPKFCKM